MRLKLFLILEKSEARVLKKVVLKKKKACIALAARKLHASPTSHVLGDAPRFWQRDESGYSVHRARGVHAARGVDTEVDKRGMR